MIATSRPLPEFTRYGGSLLLVLAVHAAVIAVALNWKSPPSPAPLPPPAMMMELAPLPEPQPLPPPVVQPPAPVEEPPLPKLVEAPKPVIEVPKPKPKPKPQPPKPQPKPQPQPPKEAPVEQPAAAAPPAPAKAPAAPPAPPPPPANAAPSWQGEIMARLQRFKEYPPPARARGTTGTVVVEFTMDAQGRVLDSSVLTSSGSSLLDRAALRAVSRAQPLPVPPASQLINGTVKLKAPFNFTLTK